MAQSLARGHRVRLTKADAFADGIAVKQVSSHDLAQCKLCPKPSIRWLSVLCSLS